MTESWGILLLTVWYADCSVLMRIENFLCWRNLIVNFSKCPVIFQNRSYLITRFFQMISNTLVRSMNTHNPTPLPWMFTIIILTLKFLCTPSSSSLHCLYCSNSCRKQVSSPTFNLASCNTKTDVVKICVVEINK